MPQVHTPVLSTFLIADMVFQMENGKWGIVGVFQDLYAPRFPTVWPRLGIFMRLTDASGAYDVVVDFQDANGRCLGKIEGIRFEVADRLAAVDIGFTANNLLVPAKGKYFFKLKLNGIEVPGDITLTAKDPPQTV